MRFTYLTPLILVFISTVNSYQQQRYPRQGQQSRNFLKSSKSHGHTSGSGGIFGEPKGQFSGNFMSGPGSFGPLDQSGNLFGEDESYDRGYGKKLFSSETTRGFYDDDQYGDLTDEDDYQSGEGDFSGGFGGNEYGYGNEDEDEDEDEYEYGYKDDEEDEYDEDEGENEYGF